MKAVLQRVAWATVRVYASSADRQIIASRSIGTGFVALLGVARGDGIAQAEWLVDKILGIRVFSDDAGKMNLNIRQCGGSVLLVSQFTLLADTRKGRRPSFAGAAEPAIAEELYRSVAERLRAGSVTVETGEFGAHMLVEIANDGPVTIQLDSETF